LPVALIEGLHREERADRPAIIPSDDRETALGWLRCVLVDFGALDDHIGLLQRLYQSPFRYPRPRIDGGPGDGSPREGKFRHWERLPEDRILAVVEGGTEALRDDEVGPLLLIPYALYDLHDILNEMHPDSWLPIMQEVGHRMIARDESMPDSLPLRGAAASVPAANGTASGRRSRFPTPWLGWAVAAALLVGLAWAVTERWRGQGPAERASVHANLGIEWDTRKVVGKTLAGFTVRSDNPGFATLIVLSRTGEPILLPSLGDKDIELPGGQQEVSVPFQDAPDAEEVVVVAAPMPLDDVIRKLLLDKTYTARQVADLEKFLDVQLRAKRVVGFSITQMALPKR
jgi:hypothetical protein